MRVGAAVGKRKNSSAAALSVVTRLPSTATLRMPEMPEASSRSRLKLAPSWKTTVLKSNWSGSC